MVYPKDHLENKRFRLELLMKADRDENLQKLLVQKCQQDILFFVNVFCWTYNPRIEPSVIPFITYEYQDDTLLKLKHAIEHGEDVFIEKSRDMGVSWMFVALQAWGLLKKYSSLYGSYKEDYVDSKGDMDSHFERLRFQLDRMPKWLYPQDVMSTYMNISSKTLGCNIAGDAGANFGTGGRRKFVIHDEFALWADDKKAFRKTKDVTNCRIFAGTPEGKFNIYGMVMTNHEDYKHLNIFKIRLHWTLHPLKTQEWYEEEKKKRTKLDIAKELDISYEDSVTGAVYPEFMERVQIREVYFNPKLPLYTAWDFGRDMNAVIWVQKDFDTNTLYIIDAYQVPLKPIEYLAAFVTGVPTIDDVTGLPFNYDAEEQEIIRCHVPWIPAYAGNFGDPYNGASIQTNARSSTVDILARYHIPVTLNRTSSLEERIRKTHLALPRIVVDSVLHDFIQSLVQSRYPSDTRSMTTEKTKPIHDRCSHFRTALEYFIDNEPLKPKAVRQQQPQTTYNPLTGERIVVARAGRRD